MLCVAMSDGRGNSLGPVAVREAVGFTAGLVAAGEQILAGRHAGQSHYVTGVAPYLVESRGMTRRAALERTSAKREIDLSVDIDGVLGPGLHCDAQNRTELARSRTVVLRPRPPWPEERGPTAPVIPVAWPSWAACIGRTYARLVL